MIVQDFMNRIKRFLLKRDIYVVLIVLLVGLGSFGLGKLSDRAQENERVTLEEAFSDTTQFVAGTTTDVGVGEEVPEIPAATGLFVGSRNSDKYHYPWCSGAQRIKEENKIWFASEKEAEAAGYTPAANCEGL